MTQPRETSPPAQPFDHRRASTGIGTIAEIAQKLAERESMDMGGIAFKVLIGVPLTLLPPLVVASVIELIEGRWGVQVLPSFGWKFLLCALVMIPTMFWYERRTRGEYLTDSVRGETSVLDSSSYGEYQMASHYFSAVFYVEIALTGPRLLLEVYDSVWGAPKPIAGDRLMAAEIIHTLRQAGQGVEVASIGVGRDRAAMASAIAYLERHEWVGVSKDRQRIWLLSDAAKRL